MLPDAAISDEEPAHGGLLQEKRPRDHRALGAVDAGQAASLRPGQAAQVEVAGEWLAGELILVGREPLEQGYRLEVGFAAPAGVTVLAGQRLRVHIDD